MSTTKLTAEAQRTQRGAEGESALTAVITWHPESEKPDDSITVLVGFSCGGIECGYWDSEFSCWRSVDGMRFNEKLTHWADLPEVPSHSASPRLCVEKKGAR